jgi:hypothetical protein
MMIAPAAEFAPPIHAQWLNFSAAIHVIGRSTEVDLHAFASEAARMGSVEPNEAGIKAAMVKLTRWRSMLKKVR